MEVKDNQHQHYRDESNDEVVEEHGLTYKDFESKSSLSKKNSSNQQEIQNQRRKLRQPKKGRKQKRVKKKIIPITENDVIKWFYENMELKYSTMLSEEI